MDKKNITTIKEDLVNDFYALAQVHSEEIWKLVQEFDDDKLQFTLELETYERERTQPAKEQLQEGQVERTVISDADETSFVCGESSDDNLHGTVRGVGDRGTLKHIKLG